MKAVENLLKMDAGGFLIRESRAYPGCYALSVRVHDFTNPTGIVNLLLETTPTGVKVKVS